MPFGAGLPFAVVIFPGRLGRERKDGVAGVVPGVSNFGVSAEDFRGELAAILPDRPAEMSRKVLSLF